MANIDVTELYCDPDMVDEMIQISRVSRVNSFGENVITECENPSVGSIQPADGKVIERIPEAERIANLMSFWMNGTIVASAPGKYTDILVFRGKRFQVKTVFDWTNWGAGWSEGLCVAEMPAGGPT
jgi:galactose-6-phosphate isomerase